MSNQFKPCDECPDPMDCGSWQQCGRGGGVMNTNEETLAELREYFDQRADADQPAGASAPIPNEEMRLLQGLDRLAQERNAYAEMIDRLQSALDRVLSRAESLQQERDELQAENERLRQALREAILWNGHDGEGVEAVWMSLARAALDSEVHRD